MMDLGTGLVIIGAPLVRSLVGWAEHSFKDGKIDKYEFAKLGETFVRVGLIGLAAFVGFNSAGMDVPVLATGAGTLVFDYVLSALKKKK